MARIVNVVSTMGSLAALSDPKSPYYELNVPAYNSSKSAVNGLTVAYAKALRPKGIAVTSICPGWVRTDLGTKKAVSTMPRTQRRRRSDDAIDGGVACGGDVGLTPNANGRSEHLRRGVTEPCCDRAQQPCQPLNRGFARTAWMERHHDIEPL